jgi:Zn finger protein HypA/HybF involved in hydrogenase expression
MKVPKKDLEKFYLEIEKLKQNFRCVDCGFDLSKEEIKDAWENDKEDAWLYIECPKCKYQNALWKILRATKK